MNRQFETAWRLHLFFARRSIPYAIIGGIAVQRWGQPRLTRDVDVTILLPPGGEAPILRDIVAEFPPRMADAVAFALEHRVLPVQVSEGSEADLSLGLPGYEEEMVARAVPFELEAGRAVRLCSAEDLVIHKALAGRPRDEQDIEGILARQGKDFDVGYVRRWLGELASLAEDPAVLTRFERVWSATPHD